MRLYFAFIAIISASLPHAGAEDVSSALAANPANSPAVPAQSAEQSKADGSNALFAAIGRGDTASVKSMLHEGTDPNAPLPVPVDPEVAQIFRQNVLGYFLGGESNLMPLMAAAALGHREIVELLLAKGANPEAHTKRYGTNALWLAGYTGQTEIMKILLGVTPGSEADRMTIEVDITAQTATLIIDKMPGTPVPISSGRKGHATPKGEFVVTNKHRYWSSTLYHAPMPFYLRLSCRDFGLHAGELPGYPASHGCIRMKKKDAEEFFSRVPVGTLVVIK
ncbi:MAG: L,D-transpeptidase family protein [Chthoniobacterales bacterium]